ncbi:MAG: FxLYD domain-containing protein [Clostridia bacterium]|nr:FxLYD domain-containing protein [Clostridia bacterium]
MDDEPINNNKKIVTIFSIFVVVVLGCLIYGLLENGKIKDALKSSNEDVYVSNEVVAVYENDEMSLDEFAEIREKIELKELFKDDYRFYYEVINNSDKTISTVDVYLILYDEEYDKPCYVRMECISALKAHSSAIASFYIDEGLVPIAGRREAFAIPELRRSSVATADVSIEYDLAKRDKITVKNNGDKAVEHVEGAVVLYDEEENIVEIETFYSYDLKPHKSSTESLLLFSKPNEVTNYKIYMTAYSYVYDD